MTAEPPALSTKLCATPFTV
jgi:hypothetical protein